MVSSPRRRPPSTPSNGSKFSKKPKRILMDEMPIIPIYFYTRVYLMRPEVRGWYPTVLDNHAYKYVYLESRERNKK